MFKEAKMDIEIGQPHVMIVRVIHVGESSLGVIIKKNDVEYLGIKEDDMVKVWIKKVEQDQKE